MIRKKFLIMLLCCLMVSGMSWAQTEPFKREFSVGPSFGMTFSSVSFYPRVNKKMKLGYTGGLTLRWLTEEHLGLQAEISYTQQGWEEKFEDQPQYRYSRTINYIELPFFTHIYFGNNRFRFYVNVGPKIGYALNENIDSNLGDAEPNRTNEQHDLALQKRFDWGICGGPGIELRTGIGSFLLEGRYYYALGDLFNSTRSDPFSKSSGQIITAKITYLLPLIK